MRTLTTITLGLLLMTGCGADDSVTTEAGDDSTGTTTVTENTADVDSTEAPSDEAPPQPSGGESNVTLELEDGTVIETSALCMVEPQEVGSQTILFTATGYSEIGFDVTQFDEDSFGGNASVDFYQTEDFENYDLYWGSDSTVGELDLELDGSTIRGTGLFFQGDAQGEYDPFAQEGIPGTLTVDCG